MRPPRSITPGLLTSDDWSIESVGGDGLWSFHVYENKNTHQKVVTRRVFHPHKVYVFWWAVDWMKMQLIFEFHADIPSATNLTTRYFSA